MDDGIRENDGRRDRDRQGRVIVGVDGSLGSLGALRRAVAEARRLGRQLCAVRVIRQEDTWVGLVSLGDEDVAHLCESLTGRLRRP